MLEKELKNLIDLIQRQQESGKLNLEELEAASSLLIAVDNFDYLPDFVKDEIYLIDMHEIEDLNFDRIAAVVDVLKDYISKNEIHKNT